MKYFFNGLMGGYALMVLFGPRDHATQPAKSSAARDIASIAVSNLALAAAFTVAFDWWVYPTLWLAPLASVTALCHLVRSCRRHSKGASGSNLALLVAVGIGLHNLGEGVAIGRRTPSARSRSVPSSSSASRSTTRPRASRSSRRSRSEAVAAAARAAGLIAGAPAVLGAWIGAAAFNASLAAFLFGFGAGAIVQVIVQLAPILRDDEGRLLHPPAVAGLLAGMALMFATGLLVAV